MNRVIKCIIFDLDRTTLNSNGEISAYCLNALRYAAQMKILLVIATGRFLSGIPEDIKNLEFVDYIIASNGASIYDNRRKQFIWSCHIDADSVQRLVNICREKGLCLEIVINGKGFAPLDYIENPVKYGTPKRATSYIQKTRTPVPNIFEKALMNINNIECANIIFNNMEKKHDALEYLTYALPNLYITSSVPSLLEISNPLSGKHNAMKFLSNILSLPIRNFLAFGDENNDAEMLKMSGIGIAVANASDKCLASADLVTLSNERDGVAHAIYSLLKYNS